MYVINARNVNDAYDKGRELLFFYGVRSSSRAGDVVVMPGPVVTVYNKPVERVLFDSQRDANPFFHLFEALWMLDGGNDARWLDLFVSDFSKRFAEEDGLQHGAYGYRWRQHFEADQLDTIIDLLKANPDDRRIVLTMWDPDIDLGVSKKDIPCNTQVYFRIRQELATRGGDATWDHVLDMTVCCRSNDIIWGAYGANAVHFSVLQEYIAARVGVQVGKYYQISNNFHGYVSELDKRPIDPNPKPWVPYEGSTYAWEPMVTDPENFDRDLSQFMAWTRSGAWTAKPPGPPVVLKYYNSWFELTAVPLYTMAWYWRYGNSWGGNREAAINILLSERGAGIASDWRVAVEDWMHRRMDKAKARQAKEASGGRSSG